MNADGLLDTSNITGCNLFAYCGNNPVNRADPSGLLSNWVLNGIEYSYNGTAADFHRFEQGLSPIEYEKAVEYQKALLAATVYAEAASYSIESRKAVANVIMNIIEWCRREVHPLGLVTKRRL